MRRILFAVLAALFCAALTVPAVAQGAPPQVSADQPYTIEYYYKCQWGHQKEFYDLFIKNHYPLLKKIQSTGRILSIKIESPAYHTSEELRWTTGSRSATRTRPWPQRQTPMKRPSSRNSGRTRRPTRGKSSGDLRFCSGILTCR